MKFKLQFFKQSAILAFCFCFAIGLLADEYKPFIIIKGFWFKEIAPLELEVEHVPNKKTVVIPATVEYKGKTYKVTALGSQSISSVNEKIKELILPNTLVRIEESAMVFNEKITELVVPNSVVYIGKEFCCGFKSLEKLTLPDKVKIEPHMYNFRFCYNLTYIYTHSQINSNSVDNLLVFPEYLKETLLMMDDDVPFKKMHSKLIASIKNESPSKNEEIAKNATVVRIDTVRTNDLFKYCKVEYSNGMYAIESINGDEIIPCIAKALSYSSDRFLVKTENGYELYDQKGNLIRNLGNYSKMRFEHIKGSGSSGKDIIFITVPNHYDTPTGIWDIETGDNIVAPYEYEMSLATINSGIKYCIVTEDDKYGICSWDGKETVGCEYEWVEIKNDGIRLYKNKDTGTYIKIPYEDLRGGGYLATSLYETNVDSNGNIYASNSNSSLYSVNNNSDSKLYCPSTTITSSMTETVSRSQSNSAFMDNLMNCYNSLMESFNGVSVMAIPGSNNKFGLLMSTSGNIKPSQVTFSLTRNYKKTIKPLSSFPRQYWCIITTEDYLPGDIITLSYDGKKMAEEIIPLEGSEQYQIFCKQRKEAALVIAQRMMNSSMNMQNNSLLNTSRPSNSNRRSSCSLCHGTGYSPVKEKPANYGNSNHSTYQCEICGDWDIHYHKPCPSCSGRRY